MVTRRVQRAAPAAEAPAASTPKGAVTRAPPMGPPEFIAAMQRDPAARRHFSALPEDDRRDCIEWINAAAHPGPRANRTAQAIARLAAGQPWRGKSGAR
jgi:uncharacterized protein YdeI (YjbR/CyaY-like superfamily)